MVAASDIKAIGSTEIHTFKNSVQVPPERLDEAFALIRSRYNTVATYTKDEVPGLKLENVFTLENTFNVRIRTPEWKPLLDNGNVRIDVGTGKIYKGSGSTTDDEIRSYGELTAAIQASETAAAASAAAALASQTAAATSESNAATSETNASTSETNAGNSETKAQEWATKAEDSPVETGPDQFSAFHWAQKAAGSAAQANPLTLDAVVKTGTGTGVVAKIHLMDSSGGAFSFNMPTTDVVEGSRVRFIDVGGTAETENITLDRNTNQFFGQAYNFIIDVNYGIAGFIFQNTQKWVKEV